MRYVPVSIVVGFTNGIAVLIALSQIKDLLGLKIAKMPADFFTQITVLASHLGSLNLYALGMGLSCLLGLFIWPLLFGHREGRGISASLRKMMLAVEGGQLRSAVKIASRMPGPIVALVSLTALATP